LETAGLILFKEDNRSTDKPFMLLFLEFRHLITALKSLGRICGSNIEIFLT